MGGLGIGLAFVLFLLPLGRPRPRGAVDDSAGGLSVVRSAEVDGSSVGWEMAKGEGEVGNVGGKSAPGCQTRMDLMR